MPLLARTIAAPLVVEIRRGALDALGGTLAASRISPSGEVAVVVGTGIGPKLVPVIDAALPSSTSTTVAAATVAEARRLEDALRGMAVDAVVAVGGGGTLDVAKWAATMVGLPFVAVATNLAHDGIASPVAVLESDGQKRSYGAHLPIGVIVDLDLVIAGPVAHVRSGIGDTVSNLSAVADWTLAGSALGETIDGLAVALARTAAEAVLGGPGDTTSEEFLTTLADSLVISGTAMSVAGTSRPCSGGCHEISHSVDSLFPGTALHGEQVAVGALFTSFLRESPELDAIDACFRRHGVARVPSDLGLTSEQFAVAASSAPGTRPDRYTILEHLALDSDEMRRRVNAFVEAFDR